MQRVRSKIFTTTPAVESFYHYKGGINKTLAQNIEAEVKAIGKTSSGCKIHLNSDGTDYYGFIRETACPAVIVESYSVDNAADVQIAYSIEEQKAFGVAYAQRENAEKQLQKAKDAGFSDAFVRVDLA